MPGCFGRRKKKSKDTKEPMPEPNSSSGNHGSDRTPLPPPSEPAADQDRLVKQQLQKQQAANPLANSAPQQQQQHQPKQQPQEQPQPDEVPDTSELITVTRSQSVHHAPPKPGNIKKAATMSRYDFLRKQDNINYADRWATLKQRYLAPEGPGIAVIPEVPKGPKLRTSILTAQSLPRQFSPPSTVVSPVKFSNWFYERQAREAETRRESQFRESRMLQIIEGPTPEEMEEAAVKIQAGFKGYKTRKELHARKEIQQPSP